MLPPFYSSELPIDDVKRYSRQIILPGVNIAGQKALDSAKVLIIGLGGLGSPVLMYLATTGIKTIGIVDHDIVELHNLQRQVVHSEKTIGLSKTASAKDFVSRLNSSVSIVEHHVRANSENISEIIKNYDVVADCCDCIQLRYAISDACRILGKKLVSASVLRWEGQICVIRPNEACYRCIFPEMKTTAQSCETSGVMGPVCGVVGSLQAVEVVKLILEGERGPVKKSNMGHLIIFNAFTNFFKNFQKSYKSCVVCRTGKMAASLPVACGFLGLGQSRVLSWASILEHIKEYVVVDIRQTDHFQMFHVIDSINIPEVKKEIERIREFKKPVVVSCYRGKSSLEAAEFLRSQGIASYSSDGGIEGFKKHIGFS